MSVDRHLWIGTSWKMNKTYAGAMVFAMALRRAEAPPDVAFTRFVVPPFTVLREVAEVLSETGVVVGAQNAHWEDAGAWTGEVSVPMVADCGATLVELGHSERRTHFGETDETVGKKVGAVLRHGLKPLVCVGETRAEKDAGQTAEVLERQVRAALSGAHAGDHVLFAYEPVWAIGEGGEPASPAYAADYHDQIAAMAKDILGTPPPVLYGGSVTAENCTAYLAERAVGGLFIGRAAWQIEGYLDILSRAATLMRENEE
ncbi:MAG: triose-phosphate isomerase [Pseudomonadota bacterium]